MPHGTLRLCFIYNTHSITVAFQRALIFVPVVAENGIDAVAICDCFELLHVMLFFIILSRLFVQQYLTFSIFLLKIFVG